MRGADTFMSHRIFGLSRENARSGARRERIFVNKIFGEGDGMVTRSSADPRSPRGGQNSISMHGEIFLFFFYVIFT